MSKPRLIRLAPGKVGFYCPDTRIHLTMERPTAELPKGAPVSKSIHNGLRGKSLLDMFHNILDENGNVLPEETKKEEKAPAPSSEPKKAPATAAKTSRTKKEQQESSSDSEK